MKSFCEYVRETNSNKTLDLFGDGDDLASLRRYARENNFDCIKFHGAIPQHLLIRRLSEYDVGIAYVTQDKYSSAPSLKSAEYAASGLPILASDTAGHRDWAKRYGFSYGFFDNTVNDIKRTLAETGNREEVRKQVANNLDAIRRFDWHRVVNEDLLPVYSRLIN